MRGADAQKHVPPMVAWSGRAKRPSGWLSNGEPVSQDAWTEVFKPVNVFGDHVELDDVSARFFRRAKNEFELCGFARRNVTWKNSAAAVPFQLFFIRGKEMSAEPDNSFCFRRADRWPGRAS